MQKKFNLKAKRKLKKFKFNAKRKLKKMISKAIPDLKKLNFRDSSSSKNYIIKQKVSKIAKNL